jgi:hypothetical protein
MAPDKIELQAINTSWQIAIQEISRMIIRDMYHGVVRQLLSASQADRGSSGR